MIGPSTTKVSFCVRAHFEQYRPTERNPLRTTCIHLAHYWLTFSCLFIYTRVGLSCVFCPGQHSLGKVPPWQQQGPKRLLFGGDWRRVTLCDTRLFFNNDLLSIRSLLYDVTVPILPSPKSLSLVSSVWYCKAWFLCFWWFRHAHDNVVFVCPRPFVPCALHLFH